MKILKIGDMVTIDEDNIPPDERYCSWYNEKYFKLSGVISEEHSRLQQYVRVAWNDFSNNQWWYKRMSLKHSIVNNLEEIKIPTIFDLLKTK